MKNLKSQFSRNITYLRNRQGLTVRAITEKYGIKRRTWLNWENDILPPLIRLPQICEILHYDNVLNMLSKDLANDKDLERVDRVEAANSLAKLSSYLLTA